MKSYLKYMIAPFLIGLLVGSLLGRFASPWHFLRRMSPEKHEEKMLKHFGSLLKLSPQQKEEIGAVLRSSRDDMDKLMSEFRPKFEAIRTATGTEIRKKLTPEQQVKFDKMHERHERQFQKEKGFPFPPPPPDDMKAGPQ